MQRKLANIVRSAIIASSLIAAAPVAMASTLSDRIDGLYSTKKSCSEITDFSLAPEKVQIQEITFNESIEDHNSFLLYVRVLNRDPNAQKKVKEFESAEFEKELRNSLYEAGKFFAEELTLTIINGLINHYKFKRLPVVLSKNVYLDAAIDYGDKLYKLSGSFKLNGTLRCIDKTDHLQSLFNEKARVTTIEEAYRFYGKLTSDETLAVELNTRSDNKTRPFLLYIEASSLGVSRIE